MTTSISHCQEIKGVSYPVSQPSRLLGSAACQYGSQSTRKSHPLGQSVSQLWQQHSEIIWNMWCMGLHLAPSLSLACPPSLLCGCLSTWVPLCLHLSPSFSLTHSLTFSAGSVWLCSLNVRTLHFLRVESRLLHISVWLTACDSLICYFIH